MTDVESTLCAKMLVKLTPGPGVNFTDISWATFIHKDPKSAKRHWWFDCLYALLGSLLVKAAYKTLVKLIPVQHNKPKTCFGLRRLCQNVAHLLRTEKKNH